MGSTPTMQPQQSQGKHTRRWAETGGTKRQSLGRHTRRWPETRGTKRQSLGKHTRKWAETRGFKRQSLGKQARKWSEKRGTMSRGFVARGNTNTMADLQTSSISEIIRYHQKYCSCQINFFSNRLFHLEVWLLGDLAPGTLHL